MAAATGAAAMSSELRAQRVRECVAVSRDCRETASSTVVTFVQRQPKLLHTCDNGSMRPFHSANRCALRRVGCGHVCCVRIVAAELSAIDERRHGRWFCALPPCAAS